MIFASLSSARPVGECKSPLVFPHTPVWPPARIYDYLFGLLQLCTLRYRARISRPVHSPLSCWWVGGARSIDESYPVFCIEHADRRNSSFFTESNLDAGCQLALEVLRSCVLLLKKADIMWEKRFEVGPWVGHDARRRYTRNITTSVKRRKSVPQERRKALVFAEKYWTQRRRVRKIFENI